MQPTSSDPPRPPRPPATRAHGSASLRFLCALLLLPASLLAAPLNVVATTSDIAALARAVGGDRLELTTLAKPTEDPHFVDPKPSFIVRLSRADALLEGGAELESGWLPPLVAQARNARILPGAPGRLVCREAVEMLEVPTELDRSQGDLHALGNPHFLVDPANGGRVATFLCEGFCRLDPDGAGTYRANLKSFTADLERRLVAWTALLAPFAGQRVVSYHNSWPYFARRFDLRMDLFLEPKPGLPPSPAHLAAVIQTIKDRRVPAILVEPHINRRTAETVARASGAALVEVSQFPGGLKNGPSDYLGTVDQIVRALASTLREKGTP